MTGEHEEANERSRVAASVLAVAAILPAGCVGGGLVDARPTIEKTSRTFATSPRVGTRHPLKGRSRRLAIARAACSATRATLARGSSPNAFDAFQ